ncbi:hypothetical protein WMY93_002562 [Mugilogobius chulae]|uniref:Uncharacterized protein n=1 Tax=Mugilogobius chulae TaxID=88201 RepID=A0AAW0PU53_9GOBI
MKSGEISCAIMIQHKTWTGLLQILAPLKLPPDLLFGDVPRFHGVAVTSRGSEL